MQRQKCIQPDTLMKNLHRPIPKSKILEGLKKSNTLVSSSSIDKTLNSSPNVSSTRTSTPLGLIKKTTTTIQSRKSVANLKLVEEKPKNTIRSMFQKQMEKSRILDSSQMNGGILDEVDTVPNITNQTTDLDSEKQELNGDNETHGICLVTGSLHKRLTRRNSITVQTPTKTPLKSNANAEISSVLSSAKKRRCTMFTPSKISFDEKEEDIMGNKTNNTTQDKNNQDGDKTVNKTVEMEICNGPSNGVANKCNNKVRQLLNTELLVNTPRDKGPNGIANSFAQPNSSVRRRTTYTPQIMDETKVQNNTTISSSITPISSSVQRRKTMNMNANASTPRTIPDALIETKSCDAVLTPTNKNTGKIIRFNCINR